MPILHQFLLVNFNPSLYQLHFSGSESPFQDRAMRDGNNRFIITTFNVHVRLAMLLIVEVVHQYDNAVKHRNDGHSSSPTAQAEIEISPAASFMITVRP
jgi:hypothetical protein